MQDKRAVSKIIQLQKQKSLRQLSLTNRNRNPQQLQQNKIKQKSISLLSDDKQNFVFSFRKSDNKHFINSQPKLIKQLSFLSDNQQTNYENQHMNESKQNLKKQQINEGKSILKNQKYKSHKTVTQKKQTLNKEAQSIEFLQNCKLSIISLQQQNQQKNIQIEQLRLSLDKLSQKLKQSQSHIKRQNQLLALYIKQTNTTQTQNMKVQVDESQQIKSLKQQIDHVNRLNIKLKYQNEDLLTKISKMGRGVSKALQTISKNNNKTDQKVCTKKFKLITPQKHIFHFQTASSRKIGRISNMKQTAHYQSPFIQKKKQIANYQQPFAYSKPFQVYESERKLQNLEQQYKKLNEIQNQQHFTTKFMNLQSILQKMNKFAQDSDLSDNQQWIQHPSFSTE